MMAVDLNTCFSVCIVLLILSGTQAQPQPPPQLPVARDPHIEPSGPHPHDRDNKGSTEHTILLTVPVIVLSVSIIIITLVVVYMVHKSRYGEFCCMKPNRSRRQRVPALDDTDLHPVVHMLPPEYDSSYLEKESPPVYCDALQDRVLVSGTVALPSYGQPDASHTPELSDVRLEANRGSSNEEAVIVIINENHIPESNTEPDKVADDEDTRQDRPSIEKEDQSNQTEDNDTALLIQQ